MLVEAVPAAQLCTWTLPHKRYGKPEQLNIRQQILDGLAKRLVFAAAQGEVMLKSPDALDAVVAAFAPIAATRHGAPAEYSDDGLIAVLS